MTMSKLLAIFLLFFALKYSVCVSVSPFVVSRIKQGIEFFEEDGCNRVIFFQEWASSSEKVLLNEYISPAIMIWDILKSYGSIIDKLICPFCDGGPVFLRRSGLWTDGTGTCIYEPRAIYDTSFSVLLVAAVYQCPNRHQVPSHHPSVLSALPSFVYIPFFLTNRAGFTISMLTLITSLVDRGISFHSIEGIIRDQYQQHYWRRRQQYEEDLARSKLKKTEEFPEFCQTFFPFPHEKLINNIFVSFSSLYESVFFKDISERTGRWLSCDHTFKSAANIGFVRESDARWIKLFKCVFCVLNECGQILHWRFTRGESFEEVNDVFLNLKIRFDLKGVRIQGIIIDNCCKWKGMFSTIFPDVPVKLDLFHAVQRFTKALSHDVRLRSGIAKEYGLIFRHPHDLGEKRVSPTPDTDTILQNLAGFQRKWSQQTFNGLPVISPAAQKAIDNIQVHIQKGCTSCIHHIAQHPGMKGFTES